MQQDNHTTQDNLEETANSIQNENIYKEDLVLGSSKATVQVNAATFNEQKLSSASDIRQVSQKALSQAIDALDEQLRKNMRVAAANEIRKFLSNPRNANIEKEEDENDYSQQTENKLINKTNKTSSTQTHYSAANPKRNINYCWIGPPAQGDLLLVAGHDVAGPIEMAKKLETQNKSDEERQSIIFWCLQDYVEFYKKEFKTKGAPSIQVRSVQQLLKEETDGSLAQQANFLNTQVSLLEGNKSTNNILKRVAFKDGFSLFLLMSQAGYFFDTNIFPADNTYVSLPGGDRLQTATSPDKKSDFYVMYSPYREHQETIKIFNKWSDNCNSITINGIWAFDGSDILLLGRLAFDIDPLSLGIRKESYKSYCAQPLSNPKGLFYWLDINKKTLKEKIKYGDINQQATIEHKTFLSKCALIGDFFYDYDITDLDIFEKLKNLNFQTNEAFATTRKLSVFYINKSQNLTFKFQSKYWLNYPYSDNEAYPLSTPNIENELIESMEDMKISPPPYVVNTQGATLLHHAVLHNEESDVIEMLLDNNADTTLKATYVIKPQNETILLTPFELATLLNHKNIIELFQNIEKSDITKKNKPKKIT